MSSHEVPIIAESLMLSSLEWLNLDDNSFDDADATLLANALPGSTNLKGIGVRGNTAITSNGRNAFLRVIFDVSSLASCAASNHACRIEGLEPDISSLNRRVNVSWNKWDKIFAKLALSSEDAFINTALLRGIPTSLIPMLLDKADSPAKRKRTKKDTSQITDLYLELTNAKRCHRHDVWDNLGQSRELNCVYELVRSWVVPMIYV